VIDRCCMCESNGEPRGHLLVHCDVASTIWSAFHFGMFWVMLRCVVDLFNRWWSFGRPGMLQCGNGAYVPLSGVYGRK
jgi:hypothetical protein